MQKEQGNFVTFVSFFRIFTGFILKSIETNRRFVLNHFDCSDGLKLKETLSPKKKVGFSMEVILNEISLNVRTFFSFSRHSVHTK